MFSTNNAKTQSSHVAIQNFILTKIERREIDEQELVCNQPAIKYAVTITNHLR